MASNQPPEQLRVPLGVAASNGVLTRESGDVPAARELEGARRALQQRRAYLPADETAPALARRMTSTALQDWGLSHLVDDACLCVSELVTNATKHPRTFLRLAAFDQGRTPCVRVRLIYFPASRLLVCVDDGDSRMPIIGPPRAPHMDHLADNGRGLTLIQTLASGFGFVGSGCTKTVWCSFEAMNGEVSVKVDG